VKIPQAQGHWLWGSASDLVQAPHRFPAQLGWKHGGLAGFRILHKPFLVVTDPDCATQIFVTKHERYYRSFHYRNQQAILGKGMISTDGDLWLKRRRQALPAFRVDTIKRVVPATRTATVDLLNRWDTRQASGNAVCIVEDMRWLAMSVVAHALLSAHPEEQEAARFGRAVADALQLIRVRNTSAFNLPLSFPTRHNRRLAEVRQILDRYIESHLLRRDEGFAAQDILDALLQARDPETGEGLSREALIDETKTLFAAGFETTASVLAWTLYLLARHPEVAERWYAEVDRVLAGAQPEWEHLEKLTWIEQVLNESMRLYPPVYTLARECIADDVWDGKDIKQGSVLLISVYGIHRAEQWWPSPEAFLPERFAPGKEWPRNAFLPFGMGKHVCIGTSFAMTEMKTILALIGQRYRLEFAGTSEVKEVARITLAPFEEIPIRLVPRR
jgi:cytochrome P450